MPNNLKKESGVYTIFFALGLAVLFGFIGLAIDTARLLVVKTELQNATDACALAAVRELNMQNDSIRRAVGAGVLTANRNFKSFQSLAVDLEVSNISFSESLEGPYLSMSDGASFLSSYVKCESYDSGFTTVFLRVLGIDALIPVGRSIATLSGSSSTCAIPMAICAASSGNTVNFGLTPGQKVSLGTSSSSGFFVWANVLGVNLLANTEYSTPLTQHGTCQAATQSGRCIGVHTGTISALDTAWNSRFGVYKTASTNPATAIPDLTGFGYRNGVSGFSAIPIGGALQDYFQQSEIRSPFQSVLSGYASSARNTYITYGSSYRRLVVMPVTECSSSSCGNGAKPLIGWACALMLAPKSANQVAEIEYIGNANDASSPCRSSGFAGGSGPIVPVLTQ